MKVRQRLTYFEASIDGGLKLVVFEPNDESLWPNTADFPWADRQEGSFPLAKEHLRALVTEPRDHAREKKA